MRNRLSPPLPPQTQSLHLTRFLVRNTRACYAEHAIRRVPIVGVNSRWKTRFFNFRNTFLPRCLAQGTSLVEALKAVVKLFHVAPGNFLNLGIALALRAESIGWKTLRNLFQEIDFSS